MSKKICIIEDEKDIVRLLSYNLEKEGYSVLAYGSGANALDFIKSNNPDLIILDIMIPEIDGFEVCKLLKADPESKHIPIIMVSAKTEESNIVTGLELGAEDYITKPFSVSILIARVRAALRRQNHLQSTSDNVILQGALRILPDQYEVYVNDEIVNLNHSEFKLLCCLSKKPGRVYSRQQIIDFMKGEDYYVTTRLIDVLLVSLRKKLGEAASYIHTVRGVGYKFKLPTLA